ncbi:MAG TPA: cation:proton antiporter [Nitrosomonas nitrosa]|uniref:Kef-type potassium/proton antiporter, CPA2 family n=1 Tax=Nitrosomonas nitrosa TaxID=52442 RepID=A0A1I4SAW5_9PROT|nr:cation:proton antiporter [Nitrosomonas nitrosa]SFM61605.1 Kef-type potassium/proton antiporter, CPA2 family [Nitrosomonas nitrosa]HNP50197.1 cation:proton antiporter [Nitrosomonas nitrosa]
MIEQFFPQILMLLGTAVVIVVTFHRIHVPPSLGYLLVGVLLGSYTPGPVIEAQPIHMLAEFGIVFLLFTIGLNFSLPQIQALRGMVLGLGTAQVLLTTLAVGAVVWLMGLPVAAAFVVGAVFAQSSTTIISKTLIEQGEEHSRHGRLGTGMSVFQDVTAVPFLIVIPALGAAAVGMGALATSLGLALAKAALAFVLVFVVGRQLLRPLFHLIAAQRSAEVFTLTVLFVSLVAAWVTQSLGMSTAFGAFLAGMVLGETEFRHQVESTIRPFRDVLLGLFFVGIGMLFDLSVFPQIWHWALAGALLLMVFKAFIVAQIARFSGVESLTAWRTGWLLAVGGEFGFALLTIALGMQAIDQETGQIALSSVLLSMIVAPFLIRYNHALARPFARQPALQHEEVLPRLEAVNADKLKNHVIICGYGRIGQSVAHFLEEEQIPYIALDLDPVKVKEAYTAGEKVFFGDAAERDILEAVGVNEARLVVISHEDITSAHKVLHHVRALRHDLPVMVRTRDESRVDELRASGATEVVPETLEAALMIAVHTLLLLNVPTVRVMRRMQQQRDGRYHLLREFFRGSNVFTDTSREQDADRLRPVVLTSDSPAVGHLLREFDLEGVAVTALVREGKRQLTPSLDTQLQAGDVIVLFGSPADLEHAQNILLS